MLFYQIEGQTFTINCWRAKTLSGKELEGHWTLFPKIYCTFAYYCLNIDLFFVLVFILYGASEMGNRRIPKPYCPNTIKSHSRSTND